MIKNLVALLAKALEGTLIYAILPIKESSRHDAGHAEWAPLSGSDAFTCTE